MKKILLILMVIVLCSFSSYALNNFNDCEEIGNHYYCTSDTFLDQGSGIYDAGDKGIYITGIDKLISGEPGTSTSQAGEDISITFKSEYKIVIINTNLTLQGGNGYTFTSTGGGLGHGGDVDLILDSPIIDLQNLIYYGTGGNGGVSYCPFNTEYAGSAGGDSNIIINSTINLIDINNSFYLNLGNAGRGCSNYEADGGTDSIDCICGCVIGTNSGSSNIDIYTNLSNIYNINFQLSHGNPSLPHCSCDCDQGGSCNNEYDYDSNAALGGISGTLDFDWSGYNDTISDITILSTTTNSQNSDAVAIIDECNYSSIEDEYTSVSGVSSGTQNVKFDSDYLYINDLDLDVTTGNGGMADAKTVTINTGACYYDAEDGGNGGLNTIYIYANNDGIINNSNIKTDTGNGGDGFCDSEGSCGSTCDSYTGGNGGNSNIYLKNLNIINTIFDYDTGAGHSSSVGGNGGNINIYLYGNNIINNNTNLDFDSGVGGAKDNDNAPVDGGSGGYIHLTSTSNITFNNSVLNFNGGNAGSADACSSVRGYGGHTRLYLSNNSQFIDSNIDLLGGTGVCKNGGDSEIISSYKSIITGSDINEIPGSGSLPSNLDGSCDNVLDNYFSIENSNFTCVSDDDATITGNGMSDVDYRFDSDISLTAGGSSSVIWNYNGTRQRFIMWNATFPATNINWDCDVAEYGNQTSISSGVTFNETCASVSSDTYYTFITDINTIKLSDDKTTTLFNYTNFTCQYRVEYDDVYNLSTPLVNVYWYKNGSLFKADNNNVIVNNELTNSTLIVYSNETNINDNFICSINVNSSTFNKTENSLSKTITETYPYNLIIKIGDGTYIDYNYTGLYNSSNIINFNLSSINDYLQNNCNGSETCNVPINFLSDTDGELLLSNLIVNYGVDNPEKTNVELPIKFYSSSAGWLNVTNPVFSLLNDEETSIRVRAFTDALGYLEDRYIDVIYSKINVSFVPNGIQYWDVLPFSPTQKNVQPFGQSSRTPILNVKNEANHSIEIYLRFQNGTYVNCTNTTFNNNSINELGWIIEQDLVHIANLNVSENVSLWSWTDFNCDYGTLFYPNLDFKSRGTDVVNTSDFWVE